MFSIPIYMNEVALTENILCDVAYLIKSKNESEHIYRLCSAQSNSTHDLLTSPYVSSYRSSLNLCM